MREHRALGLGLCVCLVGCVEPIDVSGELAELEVLRVETREGLGGAQDTQIALVYQMRDLEGDDQRVKIEVCEMTPAQKAVFRKKTKGVHKSFRKKVGKKGAELLSIIEKSK